MISPTRPDARPTLIGKFKVAQRLRPCAIGAGGRRLRLGRALAASAGCCAWGLDGRGAVRALSLCWSGLARRALGSRTQRRRAIAATPPDRVAVFPAISRCALM